ncbi:MAG TPA: VOC family protein, partial [Chloroflexota bacterium]|nr:VOC family protein [Chloroflexota bacterium]
MDQSDRTAPTPPAFRQMHHVAIRVYDLQASLDFYEGILGLPVVAHHSLRQVELVFLQVGMPAVLN